MKSTARNLMRANVLAATLAMCGACAAKAPDVPLEWKSDCVGRMQLSFPGDVDIAAHTLTSWTLPRGATGYTPPRFSDEQQAGYSSIYYHGIVEVTQTLDETDLDTLMARARAGRNKFNEQATTRKLRDELADVSVEPHKGLSWRWQDQRFTILKIGSHMLRWNTNLQPENAVAWDKNFPSLLSALSERHLFDIPQKAGVCMPYLFVGDDGKTPRSIAVTYRLKSHPDITIMLEDSNGGPIPKDSNPDKLTAEYDNDFFWRLDYQSPKKATALWKFLHEITLAGNEGYASFMELTREDNAIDYGFFAAARDYRDSPESTNLRMFVIRDAKVAKAKGIEPISKEAFIELAQTIAASVKHRATTPTTSPAKP